MSIIYNTLERLENLENLENLEKQEREGHARGDRSRSSNTHAEAHHPVLSTKPGISNAFKIVVFVMLCLGGTAIFMLRSNVPAQFDSSVFSDSLAMETELSITAMPGPLISETTKPALPAMVSTDVKKVDGIPAGDTGEPETNRDDQVDTPDAALALDSDSTPVKVEEVGSKATGISQAVSLQVEEAASPSEAPEAVRSEVELSDDSADLAAAERPASDQQPVDGQLITDARPESIATTTEIRPDLIGRTLQQARSALSRGQYFQALADLESIWPVPDNRADFWLIKGSIHLGLGQLDLAEESFQLAHALVPGHAQTSVQLAVLKQEKGDHAGALSLLKDAARRHRDVPEIYLNLGYSQQALGEFAKAGRSFKIFLDVTEGRTVYSEQRKMVSQWVSRRPAEVGSIVDAR